MAKLCCPPSTYHLFCSVAFHSFSTINGPQEEPPSLMITQYSICGLGRSLGRRHGNPLQYSCLDRGAWWATAHGVLRAGHKWMTNTFTFTLRVLGLCLLTLVFVIVPSPLIFLCPNSTPFELSIRFHSRWICGCMSRTIDVLVENASLCYSPFWQIIDVHFKGSIIRSQPFLLNTLILF